MKFKEFLFSETHQVTMQSIAPFLESVKENINNASFLADYLMDSNDQDFITLGELLSKVIKDDYVADYKDYKHGINAANVKMHRLSGKLESIFGGDLTHGGQWQASMISMFGRHGWTYLRFEFPYIIIEDTKEKENRMPWQAFLKQYPKLEKFLTYWAVYTVLDNEHQHHFYNQKGTRDQRKLITEFMNLVRQLDMAKVFGLRPHLKQDFIDQVQKMKQADVQKIEMNRMADAIKRQTYSGGRHEDIEEFVNYIANELTN